MCKFKIDDGGIVCPGCNSQNLHMSGGVVMDPADKLAEYTPNSIYWRGQGHAFMVHVTCEHGCRDGQFMLRGHKGTIIMEWVVKPRQPGWPPA